ncbi:hypothetical protein F5Y16DRAFT_417617 [Xylariaceae sp. FL0255]|nr:hypothetical protein F5Y16DRAFT_417617 [Xylariaceae sp. FL0255]
MSSENRLDDTLISRWLPFFTDDGQPREGVTIAVDCLICNTPLALADVADDNHEKFTILPCGHAFGYYCIKRWLREGERSRTGPTCPSCRKSLRHRLCRHTASIKKLDFGAGFNIHDFRGAIHINDRIPRNCRHCTSHPPREIPLRDRLVVLQQPGGSLPVTTPPNDGPSSSRVDEQGENDSYGNHHDDDDDDDMSFHTAILEQPRAPLTEDELAELTIASILYPIAPSDFEEEARHRPFMVTEEADIRTVLHMAHNRLVSARASVSQNAGDQADTDPLQFIVDNFVVLFRGDGRSAPHPALATHVLALGIRVERYPELLAILDRVLPQEAHEHQAGTRPALPEPPRGDGDRRQNRGQTHTRSHSGPAALGSEARQSNGARDHQQNDSHSGNGNPQNNENQDLDQNNPPAGHVNDQVNQNRDTQPDDRQGGREPTQENTNRDRSGTRSSDGQRDTQARARHGQERRQSQDQTPRRPAEGTTENQSRRETSSETRSSDSGREERHGQSQNDQQGGREQHQENTQLPARITRESQRRREPHRESSDTPTRSSRSSRRPHETVQEAAARSTDSTNSSRESRSGREQSRESTSNPAPPSSESQQTQEPVQEATTRPTNDTRESQARRGSSGQTSSTRSSQDLTLGSREGSQSNVIHDSGARPSQDNRESRTTRQQGDEPRNQNRPNTPLRPAMRQPGNPRGPRPGRQVRIEEPQTETRNNGGHQTTRPSQTSSQTSDTSRQSRSGSHSHSETRSGTQTQPRESPMTNGTVTGVVSSLNGVTVRMQGERCDINVRFTSTGHEITEFSRPRTSDDGSSQTTPHSNASTSPDRRGSQSRSAARSSTTQAQPRESPTTGSTSAGQNNNLTIHIEGGRGDVNVRHTSTGRVISVSNV